MERKRERANYCLSDFISEKSTGTADYVGLFAVTSGLGIDKKVAEFNDANDDYSSIMIKSLADRLAEAFAERLHARVRREFWAYSPEENMDNDKLIDEAYVGIRPAKTQLFELLNVEREINIQLTENFAMLPAASVCGYYFGNPDAQYFGVGRIGKDQIIDYASRRNLSQKQVENWLAPNLGYQR